MASHQYEEGSLALRNGGGVNFASDTIEIILVKSTYTFSYAHTHTAIAAAEISGVTGYTGGYGGSGRKTLGSKTIAIDATNHRLTYDAADPSAWALGIGDTVGGAMVTKKGASDDTTAVLLWFIDVTDTPTNGSSMTVSFDALGIFYDQL